LTAGSEGDDHGANGRSAAVVEEHLFDEIKRYVGFNEDDEARLRALGPRVVPARGVASATEFYAHILAHPDARRSITGGDAQVFALKPHAHVAGSASSSRAPGTSRTTSAARASGAATSRSTSRSSTCSPR
jgi:hypothetical protein